MPCVCSGRKGGFLEPFVKTVVFSHGKESGPWGAKITAMAAAVRELRYGVESVDYRGMDDPGARVQKLIDVGAETRRAPWCWWVRAWAATYPLPRRAALGLRGLFLLAPAFYMPGFEALYAAGRRCPHRDRARLAR